MANAVSNIGTVVVLMFTPCTAAFSKASRLAGSNKFLKGFVLETLVPREVRIVLDLGIDSERQWREIADIVEVRRTVHRYPVANRG